MKKTTKLTIISIWHRGVSTPFLMDLPCNPDGRVALTHSQLSELLKHVGVPNDSTFSIGA